MRTALLVVGILASLLGAVWIGQGMGLIRGSFMTGEPLWAGIGAGVLVVGVGLAVLSRLPVIGGSRGRRRSP